MRQHFQDMKGSPNGPAEKPGPASSTDSQNGHTPSGSAKVGEYIDFEEIK